MATIQFTLKGNVINFKKCGLGTTEAEVENQIFCFGFFKAEFKNQNLGWAFFTLNFDSCAFLPLPPLMDPPFQNLGSSPPQKKSFENLSYYLGSTLDHIGPWFLPLPFNKKKVIFIIQIRFSLNIGIKPLCKTDYWNITLQLHCLVSEKQ